MKKNCYLFVFDGFADWEASYAAVGISRSEGYRLRTIAMEKRVKRSMGGLSVMPEFDFIPEVDLDDIHTSNTGMVILPGGAAWEQRANDRIAPLVFHCLENKIPVAAICGATVFMAQLGVLDNTLHTSNSLDYIKTFSPAYQGDRFYLESHAVNGGGIITAGGGSSLEFAREIFDTLGIANEEGVRSWFQYFERITV